MSLSLPRAVCFASFVGITFIVSSAATQQHRIASGSESTATSQVDLGSAIDGTLLVDPSALANLLCSHTTARSTLDDAGLVTEIDYAHDKCDDSAVAPLRGSPRLKVVRLTSPKITDASLATLATCLELTNLDLRSTAVTDAGLAKLAGLKKLTSLSLSQTNIGDAGLKSLSELPNLETLDLDTTQVGDRGLPSLLQFKKLSVLNLGRYRQLRKIYRNELIYHEQIVDTEGPNEPSLITDRGIATLAQYTQLRSLGLRGAYITDEGIRPLTRLADLSSLDLSSTTLTGAGLAHLTQLKNLVWLDLSYTHIHDEDLQLLLQLPKLNSVRLDGTTISSAGLDELHQHPTLEDISVNGSRVGQKGYHAWKARPKRIAKNDHGNAGDRGPRIIRMSEAESRALIFGEEGADVERGNALRKLSEGDAAPFLARLEHDELLVEHRLVEHGFGYPRFNGATGLHFFVERDDLETVRRLLRLGASLSLRDERGRTPLTYARSTAMAELLLDYGAQVQPKKRDFPSALDHVPNADVAEIYLRHGADLKRVDAHGLTALHYAAAAGRIDVVRLLIERGAGVNVDASAERAPVDPIWGSDLVFIFHQSATPLSWAVSSDRVDVAEYLVQHGADCSFRRDDGSTLLDLAAWSGSVHMNRLVMEWSAKLSPPLRPTDRHLITAVRSGRDPEVVRMFLGAGADVNGRFITDPPNKNNARFRAIRIDGSGEAEPDLRDWTPLHFAAYQGNEQLVNLLLERGADVHARSAVGVTPIDCARRVEKHVPSPWFARDKSTNDGFPTAADTARERRNAARVAIHELLITVADKTKNESASR